MIGVINGVRLAFLSYYKKLTAIHSGTAAPVVGGPTASDIHYS